jgi:hypothetical protein
MKKTALKVSALVLAAALVTGCANTAEIEATANKAAAGPHALLLIVLPRLLLQLRALQTRLCQLQPKRRLAAKQTAKAWSACSRNRCRSSTRLQQDITTY